MTARCPLRPSSPRDNGSPSQSAPGLTFVRQGGTEGSGTVEGKVSSPSLLLCRLDQCISS
jgi:hypothetical protein